MTNETQDARIILDPFLEHPILGLLLAKCQCPQSDFRTRQKVCLNLFFPISISQLILPMAPRLVPFAPTTVGRFFVSKSLLSRFNFLNVSPDITLFDVPVSNSVNTSLFAILILNTVPRSDPKVSSILYISVGSGMLVKYSSGL